MLANAARQATRISTKNATSYVQSSNMATLREIQTRLKSISNIEKITKSMKMISSTKLAKAQRAMEYARTYGQTSQAALEHLEPKVEGEVSKAAVTVSGDRGLCGGIHSSVSKATKAYLKENTEARVFVLGDKAKAQLSRGFRQYIDVSFNQIGKSVPTWAESADIAETILSSETKFDQYDIVYNKFVSVIAYEASKVKAYSLDAIKASAGFSAYEVEDDEVLANYQQFLFANSIHWALTEGYASEQSAKRTAMENATKNAGDMIQKLTLTYNRGRQAVITNELIDIITGASAL
ncbi:ATP synthase F1 gamma [Conidiobolus coronatus NRRL 28638]|uniref:ATP synthase subunit gamma n=1 Tax=Conidiobolus coronatus (strain ATCC 28846 / CBS 209.66 / NRRL 28638) TaxID=796925 RepID=A0A137PHV0_CONC2|nr:ATP synthase F1 gamma [Conidiobolus coronatus NRRL 28638]|eukprot:KXN74576.1 ATP synthase F1 gamma [Conidiobolus coronatus NRRL 28638]